MEIRAGMKIKKVMMTPDLAKAYLELNTRNRSISQNHVRFLSREMQAGRWKLNGDTICLSKTRLIDGQHRLLAIIDSGMAFPMLVIEELEDEVFDTKDFGKKRSAADVLFIKGETSCTTLAAAAAFVDRYMTGQFEKSKPVYSAVAIEELLEKYGTGLRKSVNFCRKTGTKKLVGNSIMAGLHYIFSNIDQEQSDFFWTSLIGGDGLEKTSPVFVLRERLLSNSMMRHSKLDPKYIAALCVVAWNHMRSGVSVKYIRYTETDSQNFPIAR